MDSTKIKYKSKVATLSEIFAHLKDCDSNFTPPLSQRVDIEKYAQKIFERSVTFEAWGGVLLIGLLAAYFDPKPTRAVFITNVSVLKRFMGVGIASELLCNCIKYASQKEFSEIRLYVNKDSGRVIHFYTKYGFAVCGMENDFLEMSLRLIV
jgi:ribosomal protein S18 acetylase RimI-like enzyme